MVRQIFRLFNQLIGFDDKSLVRQKNIFNYNSIDYKNHIIKFNENIFQINLWKIFRPKDIANLYNYPLKRLK